MDRAIVQTRERWTVVSILRALEGLEGRKEGWARGVVDILFMISVFQHWLFQTLSTPLALMILTLILSCTSKCLAEACATSCSAKSKNVRQQKQPLGRKVPWKRRDAPKCEDNVHHKLRLAESAFRLVPSADFDARKLGMINASYPDQGQAIASNEQESTTTRTITMTYSHGLQAQSIQAGTAQCVYPV